MGVKISRTLSVERKDIGLHSAVLEEVDVV
jgi:hypothetical protein